MRPAAIFLAVLFDIAVFTTAQAQIPNGYFDGVGRPLSEGMRAAVQAQWEQLPTAEIACIDQRLNRRGRSINAMIGQGIGPLDGRVARFRRACRNAAREQPGQLQGQGQNQPARTGPSFDCRRASSDDEIAICQNDELSRLDRAIGDGYNYLRSRYGTRAARRVTDPMLRQREDCGDDVDCIRRVQSMTISLLQSRGAPVQVEQPEPPAPPAGQSNAAPAQSPSPQPVRPVEQPPQASPPAPTPPKPAAAATPPAAPEPVAAPPAAAPEASHAKPSEGPASAAPIRNVGPGITIAPGSDTAPAAAAVPAGSKSSPVVYLLVAIIIALCGVIAFLLRRMSRARAAPVAAPPASATPADAPAVANNIPTDGAIIPAAMAMPAAAASPTASEPAMNLASLAPTGKPLEDAAHAAAPAAPVADAVASAAPAADSSAAPSAVPETPAAAPTEPAAKPAPP